MDAKICWFFFEEVSNLNIINIFSDGEEKPNQ